MAAKTQKRPAADPRPTERVSKKPRLSKDASAVPTPTLLTAAVEDFPRGHGKPLLHTIKDSKPRHAVVNDESLFATTPAQEDATIDERIKKRRKLERKKTAQRLEEAKKSLSAKENASPVHVSHKRLIPGSRLLACVVTVSETELIVSLPNMLLGHIPAHRAMHLPARSEEDDDEDDDDVSLSDTYIAGQLLLVAVVSTHSAHEAFAASRRIELTLLPEVIYEGIGAAELSANFPVNARVSSREDTGYVLETGVGNITAFLSYNDAEKQLGRTDITVGTILPARVKAVHPNRRTCSLSFEPFAKSAMIEGDISIDCVLPGMLVKARITSVGKGNVAVRFLGLFDGSIDVAHLANRGTLSTSYRVGQQIKARIIASLPWQSSRTFALSDLPHLLTCTVSASSHMPLGTITEHAKIVHVEKHWGLMMSLPNANGPDVGAFVPIAHASDERVEQLSAESGLWSPGSTHRARVIGFSSLTGLTIVSLRQSILQQRFMAVSDLKVGQVVEAVVQRLTSEALFVSIGGSNDAIVWPLHYSDNRLKHPERRFRPGAKLPGRIFSIDPVRNRIELTLKRSIVNSALPILGNLKDASSGTRVTGVVTRLDAKGANIELIGGHRLYIPLAELSDNFIHRPEEAVTAGQAVEVQLFPNPGTRERIKATLRAKIPPEHERRKVDEASMQISHAPIDLSELKMGTSLPVRLVKRDMHGWLVQLSPNVRGRVHWTDTTDNYESLNLLLVNSVVMAQVIDIDAAAARVDLGLRQSLVDPEHAPAPRDPLLVCLSDLQQGMRIRGIVSNVASAGLFVAIARSVTARVLIKELFDEFVEDWQSHFTLGQIVEGSILSIDERKEQVEMRLRSSDLLKTAPGAVQWQALAVGQHVACRVKALRPYGCLLSLEGSSISGLCHQSQMTCRSDAPVIEGERLTAVIVEVDPDKRRIGFSMDLVGDTAADHETFDGTEHAGDLRDEDALSESSLSSAEETVDDTIKRAPVVPLTVPSAFAWTDDPDPDAGSTPPISTHSTLPQKNSAKGLIPGSLDATSTADFERMVHAAPNMSSAWIRYMTFCLDTADLQMCRQVARRALDAIHYREEGEKLNVWMALLKAELAQGSEASFEAVFAEAVHHNDAWLVHSRLADIYEQFGHSSKVAPMLSRSIPKFSSSVDFWIRLARAHFRDGKNDNAHEVLQRSLKSLASKQPADIDVISKFAQLEFKVGDIERGRTLFEGILDKAPKRLDLWNIYIDMEQSAGHAPSVRSLFDRLLQRHLSTKKAKSTLKKWLAFEKVNGTDENIETVRQKAIDYVQRAERADRDSDSAVA